MELNTRQKKAVNAPENRILCLAGGGSGKCQPNSLVIPTPNGNKRIGDIKVGDYLFDKYGLPTKVLMVFPQGKKDVYEVGFTDGRKSLCCKEHIWRVHKNTSKDQNSFVNMTLEDIMKKPYLFNHKGRIKGLYSIPCSSAVIYKNTETLVFDPYTVGKVFAIKDCMSIPKEYKYSTIEDRYALIQGLMDSNGYIDYDNGKYTTFYATSSFQMMEDFLEVMGSLGYVCSPIKNNRKNIDKEFIILIKIPNSEKHKLFKESDGKKSIALQAREKIQNHNYNRTSICSIKSLGYQEEMTCFYVDNEEHLYLTNNFIVTHNTRVLSERVFRLLNEGVDPSKIVCITFTRMAAEEMRKRFGDKGYGMFIGTIHSYANYLCVKNGIETEYLILNQKFDKILEKALTLPQRLYDSVDHLLVDEFQDTSSLEFRFMNRIPSKNIFLIGDNRQAIYGFRGSSDQYLKLLYSDSNWTKYYLVDNYRCAPNIIDFADDLIATMPKLSPAQVPYKKKNGIVEKCSFNDAVEEMEWTKDWGNWFILCRTNEEVNITQEKLSQREIPCITFKKGDLDLEEMSGLLLENRVKVLTIHTAKGLESPKVIVIGAKTFNEEERKIAYVAATRAEQALYWCPAFKVNRKNKSAVSTKNMGIFADASKKMISFI